VKLIVLVATQKKNAEEIADIILEKMKKPKSLKEFVKDRLGHDQRYAINYTKAQKELNWNPTTPFEKGIENTIDWYINNQKHWSL
jgi:dTDP-glucose 4,6-dehydratase